MSLLEPTQAYTPRLTATFTWKGPALLSRVSVILDRLEEYQMPAYWQDDVEGYFTEDEYLTLCHTLLHQALQAVDELEPIPTVS